MSMNTAMVDTCLMVYPNLYKPATCIHALPWSKRTLNFHNPRRRFVLGKADFPTFYNPRTCFALVKTDSPSFYKHVTRFEDYSFKHKPRCYIPFNV